MGGLDHTVMLLIVHIIPELAAVTVIPMGTRTVYIVMSAVRCSNHEVITLNEGP